LPLERRKKEERVQEVDLKYHPYLQSRGIPLEVAKEFGIGVSAGRLLIPIHSTYGLLASYVERRLDDSEPRYKFSGDFHKNGYLYNYHRAKAAKAKAIVLVEGFFQCIRIWQAGYKSVVALMGSTMSERQENLLLRYWKFVFVAMDGDEPGRKAQAEIITRLTKREIDVIPLELPSRAQVDHYTPEQVREAITKGKF